MCTDRDYISHAHIISSNLNLPKDLRIINKTKMNCHKKINASLWPLNRYFNYIDVYGIL